MKRIRSIPSRLSRIAEKNKANFQGYRALATLLIFILLVLSIGMIQGTLGKLQNSLVNADSATAAKFNVIITTPNEFITEQGITSFEYYFSSIMDEKTLEFNVYNDGEIDVLCTPHVSNGIFYRIFIDGKEKSEFVLKPKEYASVHLTLKAFGLDTSITEAEFYIDIKQIAEGI